MILTGRDEDDITGLNRMISPTDVSSPAPFDHLKEFVRVHMIVKAGRQTVWKGLDEHHPASCSITGPQEHAFSASSASTSTKESDATRIGARVTRAADVAAWSG